MDNPQFWIYIIIAVIYLISRAMKKSNQRQSSGPARPREAEVDQDNGNEGRSLTFEELLREITESKQQKPRPQPAKTIQTPVARPKPAYVDYDDDLKDEAEDLEDVNYDYRKEDRVYDIYEKAKQEAFSRASLEETLPLEKRDIDYARFREFSIRKKKTVLDDYVAELKKPSGFKKAIVLSEILNRKF